MGLPQEIYNAPNSRFVADFIGTSNFVDGVVESSPAPGRYVVRTGAGRLVGLSKAPVQTGAEVTVSIRPERIELSSGASDSTEPGVWTGKVLVVMFLGDLADHRVRISDVELQVRSIAARQIAGGKYPVAAAAAMCSLAQYSRYALALNFWHLADVVSISTDYRKFSRITLNECPDRTDAAVALWGGLNSQWFTGNGACSRGARYYG